ncbi:hypothetical protein [Streptococcus phage vB_Sags-UPM1]|nr:hypothetical protein [Streptococcus phage vB_Sags-UPM1]
MVIITLVIHDSKLHPVLLLDNEKQGTLNYFDDTWTRQLTTGSSVFEFSVYKKTLEGDNPLNHKYQVLNDQAFVSFVHKDKVQLFNIMQIEETETTVRCYCENLNLELLNEYCNPYKATKAMSFEEYLVAFDILNWGALTIGTNEVNDKKLTLEWTGQDTKLARLLSIANNFDAEIEFETQLHNNHTFKAFIVNVYKEYEEGKSYGVGRDKTDVILRYQKNISGIRKTVDKRQIYNAIRPYGKKTVKGERVISNPVTRKVTKTVGSNRTYLGGDLKYYGHTIKKANVQAIINYAVQYNILPSGIITQLYLESYWGDSAVGRRDNNWAGMTGGAQTRPSGVKVTTGMARPANEGGTYMHYASVDDFLKDYTYLLAKQGIYNVVGKKNIADYTKGLFTAGGAKYNYAEAKYQSYTNLMTNIRNGINKVTGNILDTIDKLWQTPVQPITAVNVARRATKTIQALNEATRLKGRRIGSGQCYALSGWYAKKLDGAWIDSSIGGIRGRIGGGMAAALIGTDYNWGAYGWKLERSPNASNLQAGGIYSVKANFGAPFYTGQWGHTGIIKSVSSTRVTVLEQNFAGRMYVVENSYEINAFARGLQTVCYPREIAQGMSVNGATTQQVSGGTQISYEEVVQEAQTESYEEEQIIYIDNSIYKEWKDENGKVEYYLKNGFLYAPLSRDRYPSVLTGNETRDNWIRKDMEVETDSQDVLMSTALKDLKAHAYPAITYEVDGYVDLEIGDVVRIQDDGYQPPLILSARVVEQVLSKDNPNSNKTKFSNFVEKESQLASDLISDMLRLYDESIPYEIKLATSNGVAFKNGTGESVLTPSLQKNGKDYEAVYFYKNGDSLIDIGPSLIVKASDFNHVLNVTVEAYINEELVATAQVSFTDTEDGTDGVGIKSTSVVYGLSNSADTQPILWTGTIPVAGEGQYLWTRKITDYTDDAKEDTIEYTYSFQGKTGVAGTSIKVSKIEYQVGASGTVTPSGAWLTTIPSVPDGQFLWSKTTMSDNSVIYGISKQGATGPKGDKGADGVAGKDGVGVKTTTITYGISANETTQPTNWTTSVPALVKGQYLWTKTVWAYTDSTSETGYVKTYIAKDGNNGSDGIAGKDGVGIKTTTITYKASTSGTVTPNGTWTSAIPSVPSGQFLWTKTVWTYTDNTNETGYSVAKMGEKGDKGDAGPQGPTGATGLQGPKGDQGVIGPTGADGKPSYTHIAYATNSTGTTGFSVSDNVGKTYIGMYVDNLATDSTDPKKYKWNLIKGADGAQGIAGPAGKDGKTPYWHTAYANSADGTVDFSVSDSANKRYIGQYTDYDAIDSNDPKKYRWTDMIGTVVVGTNNLINGTKSFSGEDWFTSATLEDENISNYPFTFKKWISGQKVSHAKDIMVEQGVTYTFSAYVKREVAGNLYFYLYDIADGFITSDTPREAIIKNVDSNVRRFEITFTPTKTGKIRPRFAMVSSEQGSFSTGGFMLVRGNKTGDWQESEADKASNLDSKADGAFTVEQLNAIAEEQRLMKANLEAAASLQEVQDKAKELLDQIKKIEDGQKVSEQTMISNANRVVQILAKLENVQLVTEAITQYMSYSNDGLVIKMKDGTSSVRVTTDRIAFYSGGTETAFISQGYLQIESGVFTLRLRIGSFLFEESSKGRLQIKKIRGIGG